MVASIFFRVPDIRAGLALSNAELGLLLLAAAAGSLLSLPSSGSMIRRWGPARVVRGAASAC